MNEQQRTAMELALEALEKNTKHLPAHFDCHFEAIAAIKEALAQDALQALHDENKSLGLYEQEPVMKEEWLLNGAAVPVNVETTAALVAEIHRLIKVVGGMALAEKDFNKAAEQISEGRMVWKIQPIDGSWWLFYTPKDTRNAVWWHVYRDKYFPVFSTLDEVFNKIKEKNI